MLGGIAYGRNKEISIILTAGYAKAVAFVPFSVRKVFYPG